MENNMMHIALFRKLNYPLHNIIPMQKTNSVIHFAYLNLNFSLTLAYSDSHFNNAFGPNTITVSSGL